MKARVLERIAAAACAACIVAACGSESSDNLLASAKQYLDKKDGKAAVIQLKNALQKNPDSAEARFLLGRALLETGDAATAAVELRKARELEYADDQVLPALARALVAAGEYKKAVEQFADATLGQPRANADLRTSVATAHAAQGETEQARAALRAALEWVPDHVPALVATARLDAAAGSPDKALASIERVLASHPADAQALQFKGDLLLYAKSDLPAALDAYRKTLDAEPRNLAAHIGAIEANLMRRDLAATAAQVDALRKVFPDHPQTNYYDALLAHGNDDAKRAGELIQKVLRVAPGNPKALQLAGAIELKNQALAQAEDHLTKALQLAPSLVGARRLLAQSYVRSGQPEKALAVLEPLLARNDADAQTLSLAAQAEAQSGDVKSAEAYVLRAAKLNPTETRSRVALALSRAKPGGGDAALAEVETIAAEDSGAYADIVLVNAYLRKGSFDKALHAVEGIEKKQPDKPYAANLRGRIQLLRNDAADARRSFERALSVDPKFVPAAANLAMLDLADGRPDAARKRFDGVLAADPKNVQAMVALAGLRARAGGSSEEVAGLLAKAVKAAPADAAPRLALVNHFLAQRDAKQALAAAQDGSAALPQSAELVDALGRAQAAAGERNQAVNSFTKLTTMQPGSPQGFLRLAAVYAEAKDVDAARASLGRALGVKPNLLAAQRALVDLELRAGRLDEALAVARTVRRQRPAEAAGFLLEGSVEAQKNNLAAAREIFRAGLKQAAASTELAVKMHAAFAVEKKPAEAAKFAASWLAAHPRDGQFLSYLGDAALAEGDYKAAEGYFRRTDEVVPGNASTLNNLAWTMAQLGKPGAVEVARKADALAPNSPLVMDTLAMSLASENQVAQAIEVQKKALAIAPEAHPLRLSLAKLYIRAGDKTAARAELDRLAKLEGKFPAQSEVSRLLATL